MIKWAGEGVQRLRALADPAEELGSVLRTHMGVYNWL